jgi:hypothetical protein
MVCVAIVVLLVGGVSLLRITRSVRRTAANVEIISGIVLESVAKPLANIPTILETGRNVVGWVQQYLSKERRDEPDDDS